MDGPNLSLHTGVSGCEIACLILSSISLSVTTIPKPPSTTSSSHQTLQIDAAHWCAVHQIQGLSNTPPTRKEWWERDSAWNGGTHTHTYIQACSWNGSLNLVPNDEHFFGLLCHLFPRPSFSFPLSVLTSLTCHDQMGAFRVQWLTWTLVPSHFPFVLTFILLSLHPSITPHRLHHQQFQAFLFHSGTDSFCIIHLYVNNIPTTTHSSQLIPPVLHKVQ